MTGVHYPHYVVFITVHYLHSVILKQFVCWCRMLVLGITMVLFLGLDFYFRFPSQLQFFVHFFHADVWSSSSPIYVDNGHSFLMLLDGSRYFRDVPCCSVCEVCKPYFVVSSPSMPDVSAECPVLSADGHPCPSPATSNPRPR